MITAEMTLSGHRSSTELKPQAYTNVVVTLVLDDNKTDEEKYDDKQHSQSLLRGTTTATQDVSHIQSKGLTRIVIADVVNDDINERKVEHALPLEVCSSGSIIATKTFDVLPTASDGPTTVEHSRLSLEILNILEKYGRHVNCKPVHDHIMVGGGTKAPVWIGKKSFLSHVCHHVRQGQPIQLTLPAFPCKSVCQGLPLSFNVPLSYLLLTFS